MVGPGEDVGALGVHAHVGAGAEQQVQAGLAVRREDERLDAAAFAQDPRPWEVA